MIMKIIRCTWDFERHNHIENSGHKFEIENDEGVILECSDGDEGSFDIMFDSSVIPIIDIKGAIDLEKRFLVCNGELYEEDVW